MAAGQKRSYFPMPNEPIESPAQPGSEAPASPTTTKAIAPLWNTLLVMALILANSLLGSTKTSHIKAGNARILVYSGTFVVELILFLIMWLGIRKRIRVRELIGGGWNKVEDFLLDLGIGIVFLIVAAFLLAGLRIALGTLDLTHLDKQLEETKRTLGPLIPHSKLEAGLFVLLSMCAGFFEEVIFRGYLQRQIGNVSGRIWVGITASAVLFGAAHGYQGWRMMIVIAVFGAFFGILAHFRRSLRPGIIAHAIQDAYSGVALFFLVNR